MWSQITLCLLVGFAFASEHPGWNPQYFYVYQVRGRSLASLDQISNEYSGIVFKAQLEVQPRSDGNLGAKISDAQYAKIQGELSDGWETEIPDSKLTYQPLPLSSKPFQIVVTKGAIRNVVVENTIKNWEANMIKAIVSQLQLDTQGTNKIKSSINMFTQENSNAAVFKTMEETVTGVSETLYEIHPYPDYVLQSQPWVVPHKHLIENGEVIEIVKNKNYTHTPQGPSYHAGLEGILGYQPGNKIGDFFSRASVTQAVVTGSLSKFTIQSSVTVEELVLSPTMADQQKGSVYSKLNVTLLHVAQPTDASQFDVQSPVEVGVVYAYDYPYSTDNSPRQAKEYDHSVAPDSAESRTSRHADSDRYKRDSPYSSYRLSSGEDEDWHQDQPKLDEAPASPLLPLTVGFDGQAFKLQQNIVPIVRKLSQEMGQEYSHPNEILQQQTAGKFVFLTSLVRTMDENEVRQVANQLQGEKTSAWFVYRDAVAQAGTGPALKNIKEWVEAGKVTYKEGAELIATTAQAARQPTEEYMKTFNLMLQDEKIMSTPFLNESVLLSYTTLVHHVYANKGDSRGKFPVYSFGAFRTERGQNYIIKTVIPQLTRKLNEAITNADTPKIHAYIRALGNIGQQQILDAFKPYLEGQRKASHFQRVLMVMALDQLVNSNPKVARSVLYKIYQNPSEFEQVRVAAVYQLIRTDPSPAMLQRMASYTNVDTSAYVNAAVKSIIQSAARLESHKYAKLRAAAQSAEPLLTSQHYGVQYSEGFLHKYVVEESLLAYEQRLYTYSGEDHAIPRSLGYALLQQSGGVNQPFLTLQAMVSSVEDLINVYQQQTKQYKQHQHDKQQQDAGRYPWSSEYTAKVLNLQNVQREQLEGMLYLKTAFWQKIFSFDNHTIESLPEDIKEFEEKLRKGEDYDYSKMIINHEAALAFPTVLGLPFLYTHDQPVLVRVEGSLKATAQPPISNGEELQRPDTINGEFDIKASLSSRVQTQFGFFTPFDHQRYTAGYNKNFQLVLPLTGNFELKIQQEEKKQFKIELQNPASQKNVRLVHFSSWPYTAQNDIYSPKPVLKIIRSQYPHRVNKVFGEKSTGIAVALELTSDQIIDPAFVYEKLSHSNLVSAALNPWVDDNIQYVHMEVGIDQSRSTTQQVSLGLLYQHQYETNDPDTPDANLEEKINEIPSFTDDPQKRLKEFHEKLVRNIDNVHTYAVDAIAEFQGQSKIKYSATAGLGRSDVDPISRYIALFRKVEKQTKQTVAYVYGISYVPNTNGLNLKYAMEMDPTSKAYFQGLLEKADESPSRVDAHIQLSKSKDRVEYLKEQPDYQECERQMSEGNYQLPVCAKMTAEANLLDKFSIEMVYANMDPRVINATYKAYSILRHKLYPRVEENIINPPSNNRLDFYGQFSEDLHSVNFSINSEYGNAEVRNAPIGRWTRQLLVPHPVFHVKARLIGESQKLDTYRPICVVDNAAVSTFDNKTYPSSFSTDFAILLHYVPNRPSSEHNKPEQTVLEQLHQHIESYIVYARASQERSSQKEIQIVYQAPSTGGKVVKVVLTPPRQGQYPIVYVNDQQVTYTAKHATDFYDGQLQVYGLPNQEVKVEVHGAFYVIYNGQVAKITSVNSKFRDASRGLCGTFTGESETDFVSSQGCIIHNPQDFINNYTIDDASRLHGSQRSAQDPECYQKEIRFATYISNSDAGHSPNLYERRSSSSCTKLQTRYVEEGGEICFTTRPLPVCKSSCREVKKISKNVPVYCEQRKPGNTIWKEEIDKGASPDFSLQHESKTIRMEMPQRCLP